jgi:hypothetical protein
MTMRRMTTRVIAVDWSGAVRDAGNIWLAEVVDGEPVRLERMKSRQAVLDGLIDLKTRDPHFVAGLDFAFSFPEWFAREYDCAPAYELWCLAEREGERWLSACSDPFWGKGKGGTKPRFDGRRPQFRTTELDCQQRLNLLPKSVFQIGGAGAVGTGSIRGMPVLRRLHDAGFSIWPFAPLAFPTVVEIYPRLFAPGVTKSFQSQRLKHIDASCPGLPERMRTAALDSEDAFDALISALGMWRHRDQLAALPEARDDRERIEGAIWMPSEAPPLHGVERGSGGEV